MSFKTKLEKALYRFEASQDRFVLSTKTAFKNLITSYRNSLFASFKENGAGTLEALFTVFYIKCLDKESTKDITGAPNHPCGWYNASFSSKLDFLHNLSRPLARLLKVSGKSDKTERAGFFSDSSVLAVKRGMTFLKRHAFILCFVLLLSLFLSLIASNNAKNRVLEVKVNGVLLGFVDNAEIFNSALASAEKRVSNITGECYDLPAEITFSAARDKNTLSYDEIYTLLSSYTLNDVCYAYSVFVDSEKVASVMNRSDVDFALDALVARHNALTGDNAHIANRIEVRYEQTGKNSIISRTRLTELLTNTSDNMIEENTRLLSAGAESDSVSADAITEEIGESLIQSQKEAKSVKFTIDYATISYETVREYVDFETRFIEDDSLYQGQSRTSVFGHRGRANVTYEVASVGDKEISRTPYSKSMIYEPVTEVIRVGTRPLPETMSPEANGGRYMILPLINYYVSDYYGWRNLYGSYQFHYGLDLAANYGTSIYAAASGEVVYAEFHHDFGWCVKIEHADGAVSLYAHCSKLLVSEGDTVKQGEIIAQVGSTGQSYGNHCHFEVIVDGERIDPETYIYEN